MRLVNALERADHPLVSPFSPGPADLGEEAGARILVGWALQLALVQPKSSGSSRFPVNILTNLALPRYVAFRFVVKVTQGNGRGGGKRGSPACFSGVFCYSDMSGQGNYWPRLCVPPLRPCVLLRVSFMEKPLHGLLSFSPTSLH